MKQYIALLVLAGTLLLSGCAAVPNKKLRARYDEAKETKYECFIELNDGKIIPFETLAVKAKVFQYERLYGDGQKLPYTTSDIKAFQTKDCYAINVYGPNWNHGETPFANIFANRLFKGKIQLYVRNIRKRNDFATNSGDYHYETTYYLRKGDYGIPSVASKSLLKEMISDKKAVLEEFESIYKKAFSIESMISIIEAYN